MASSPRLPSYLPRQLGALFSGGGGGGVIPSGGTEQQSLFVHNGALVFKGARQFINLMSLGAKVDDVTDDTAAWKRARDLVGTDTSTTDVFLPNTGKRSRITDTIRFYQSLTEPMLGLHIFGEGGFSDGLPGRNSGLLWDGAQIRGTAATTSDKLTNVVQLNNVPGLLTPQVGGGTAAIQTDIVETWGWTHPENNGRFPICRIPNDDTCFISNINAIAGDTGSWLLERNVLDIRTTGPIVEDMSFYCKGGGPYATSHITWTQSPFAGGNTITAIRLRNLTFANDNIIISGQYPVSRWAFKIGTEIVPYPGNPLFALDVDGFPEATSPSNCDLGIYEACSFGGQEQGGVFWDNTNGNDYAHTFYTCDFVHMPMGAYCVAPYVGQGNFIQCGGGAIWDTVFSIEHPTLRTTVFGGHSELIGQLAAADQSIDLENHTALMGNEPNFGWTVDFGVGHPIGLGPFGRLISCGADFMVKNCEFNPGGQPTLMYVFVNSRNSRTLVKATVIGNRFLGNTFAEGTSNGKLPFFLTTTKPAPYKLFDGATLTFTVTDGATGVVGAPQTVTFHASDFRDIGRCWPWEIAYAFQKDPNSTGVIPWFRGDGAGLYFLKAGANPQPLDAITFTGGSAATELGTSTANAEAVAVNLPPIILDSNGTVYADFSAPVHLVSEGNALFNLNTTASLPVSNIDAQYYTTPVPDNATVALRNFTPGLSMTNVACRNMGGTITWPGGTTSAHVFFPINNPELDPEYRILVAGLGPIGYSIEAPSMRGFTVAVTADPGAGVTIDWFMDRPQPPGVDPAPFGIGPPGAVLWIDPNLDVVLSTVSARATTNNPDDLRPNIHQITDQAHGTVFTTVAAHNDMQRIDQPQPPTAGPLPNSWPYIYTCFQTNPGALDAGAGTILTIDAYTLVLVCCIPAADFFGTAAPAYMVDFNGLGVSYYTGGPPGSRSLSYFTVNTYVDSNPDALPGKWELIVVSKTSGQAPVFKVNNGAARTLVPAPPTTFTPLTARTIAVTGTPTSVAFAAIWASDVSASPAMATLIAALNVKYQLF